MKVKIAALFLAAAVLLPAGCASGEPEEVDWITMEFDPDVVAARTAAEMTPPPEADAEKEAQNAAEYYIGLAEEAETEKARLEAELEEIKIFVELLRGEGEEELALKYEQLARERELAIAECEEDAATAAEMSVAVKESAGISAEPENEALDGSPPQGEPGPEPEPEPEPETAEQESAPVGG